VKIIFAGTPEFSALALQKLIESEHQVIAVFTQPDRPAGRGRKLAASPVKELALQHDLPVYQPPSLKQEENQQLVSRLNADIMVVVAYGLILPQAVLDAPKYGCLNIHASLLPRWRGAAPIQRAILHGDTVSGVTIMQMDAGLDTGDMLLIRECPIAEQDTGSSLHDKLAQLGAEAILDALHNYHDLQPQKQDDAVANYARKLDKQEACINWNDDALEIVRKIKAFNSWPVAYTDYQGQVLRIWNARQVENYRSYSSLSSGTVISQDKNGLLVQCGSGAIQITELQMPGKKRIAVSDFINSHQMSGAVLGA